MRSLATRDAGSEVSKALPDVDRRLQGRRLRRRHRRDLGHRPGRCGHRAARRRLALRDDARVRRGVAAREDRHARLRRFRGDQQVRPQGRAGRAARRAQAGAAQSRGVQGADRRNAGVRHDGRALQRRRRDRALPGDRGQARGKGLEARSGQARARRRPGRRRRRSSSSRRRACAISPRSRTRCASITSGSRRRRGSRASGSSSARRRRCSPRNARTTRDRSRTTPDRKPRGPRRSSARAISLRSTISSPRATRSSIRARRSCSTCGRRPRPPTPATNTS